MTKLYSQDELNALKLSQLKAIAKELRLASPDSDRSFRRSWIDTITNFQQRWGSTVIIETPMLDEGDFIKFKHRIAKFRGTKQGSEVFHLERKPQEEDFDNWSDYRLQEAVWNNPETTVIQLELQPDKTLVNEADDDKWVVLLDPIIWHSESFLRLKVGDEWWKILGKAQVVIKSIYSVNDNYWITFEYVTGYKKGQSNTISEIDFSSLNGFVKYSPGMEDIKTFEFQALGFYISGRCGYESREIKISISDNTWSNETITISQQKQRKVVEQTMIEQWQQARINLSSNSSYTLEKATILSSQLSLAKEIVEAIDKFATAPEAFF